MRFRPRRSVLYMPGSNARALDKARTLPADALILDLEDAVAPDQKADARARIVENVKAGGYGKREVIVRVNALDSPWGKADIADVGASGADAILIPKVSTPGDIMLAARELRESGAPDSVRLWAMMETPLAILNADSIARTAGDPASRLSVLVMGTNDLAKETRARQVPGRCCPGSRPAFWRRAPTGPKSSTASTATSRTPPASGPNANRAVISAWTARP